MSFDLFGTLLLSSDSHICWRVVPTRSLKQSRRSHMLFTFRITQFKFTWHVEKLLLLLGKKFLRVSLLTAQHKLIHIQLTIIFSRGGQMWPNYECRTHLSIGTMSDFSAKTFCLTMFDFFYRLIFRVLK